MDGAREDLRAAVARRRPEHPLCSLTYVSLRVLSDELTPEQLAARLGVEGWAGFTKGEDLGEGRRPRRFHVWSLSTEGRSTSRDTRDHLGLLLARCAPMQARFRALAAEGCVIDCLVRWDSVHGHDGPWFDPEQLRALADLGAVLWMDTLCPHL